MSNCKVNGLCDGNFSGDGNGNGDGLKTMVTAMPTETAAMAITIAMVMGKANATRLYSTVAAMDGI